MIKSVSRIKDFCRQSIVRPEAMPEMNVAKELRQTRAALDSAYRRFEEELDEIMLDAVIYEIQSLRARYRYLLRLAREQGIECVEISVFD